MPTVYQIKQFDTENATGTQVIEEYSFDAWGRRRNPDNRQDYSLFTINYSFTRGYTGHSLSRLFFGKHLDMFALINIACPDYSSGNGRVYDPEIGRFLSPDPYVQLPDFTQNYNRYSYVLNNPLSYVDPSGEIVWFAVAVGAAMGEYMGYKIGDAKGAEGLEMLGYVVGGAIIGGLSGGVGAEIAAAGGFMSNTMGMAYGSLYNSVGMSTLSGGMTDVNVGFGFASYNFTQGEWTHLLSDNISGWQRFGYIMGTMTNVSDIIAWNSGTNTEVHTQLDGVIPGGDKYGHSAMTGDDINISVGQGAIIKEPGNWFKNSFSTKYADTDWKTYAGEKNTLRLTVTNVRKPWLKEMSKNLSTKLKPELIHTYAEDGSIIFTKELTRYSNLLNNGVAKYQLLGNSCSYYVAKSLWLNGVPTLGIAPVFTHASLLLS